MIKNLKNLIGFSGSPSSSKRDSHDGGPDDLAEYPDEAIHQVLLRCDLDTLFAAKQVCKRFDGVMNNKFWLEKCERDKVALPPKEWRRFLHNQEGKNFDYMYIYCRHNPYSDNVLKGLWNKHPDQHPQELARICAELRKDRVAAESPPHGSQFTEDVRSCYTTSYGWGERRITLDLVKLGVEEWVLDNLRPRIVIKEWHAPRDDCGSIYELHAQLLTQDERFERLIELPRFKKIVKEYPQWSGGVWVEEEIAFDDYPVGMRKLAVVSRGKDTQFWQGQYGTKFANTTVRIEFVGEPRLYHASDVPDGTKRYHGPPEPRARGRLGFLYGRHRMVPDFS